MTLDTTLPVPLPVAGGEVETLLGDPTKAQKELGWVPRTSFDQLVDEMIAADLKAAQRDALVRQHGFDAYNVRET